MLTQIFKFFIKSYPFLVTLFLVFNSFISTAEEVSVTDQCNKLSAHPYDQQQSVQGISFDKINAQKAIQVCALALKNDPDNSQIQYQYGRVLSKGEQYKKSMKWLLAASKQNYLIANTAIGYTYYAGLGVKQDYQEAFKWFKLAADNGNLYGQYFLGLMTENGFGTNKNDSMAFSLFKKSAEQGYVASQVMVGNYYSKGIGGAEEPNLCCAMV